MYRGVDRKYREMERPGQAHADKMGGPGILAEAVFPRVEPRHQKQGGCLSKEHIPGPHSRIITSEALGVGRNMHLKPKL